MSIVKDTEEKMKTAINHLKELLQGIRTSHANPAMLDSVMVEAYGTPMKIRDVANVTTPEPRQLLITPFDANNASAIGKGIEKANIGYQPIVDGNVVRINIPPMDESMRKEMAKLCHKRQEESKVIIRNIRREGNEAVRKQKSDGDIGEDEMHAKEKEIQNLTDKYCKIADEVAAQKEKEVSTI